MPRGSLTREQLRRAAEDLKAQGVAPTRENLAEQSAVSGDEDTRGAAARALVSGRGGPSSEIANRKQQEADEKRRRQQPPAELLRRFREQNGR
jgi:hypothetical protein